jgi:hypothetical protein
MGLVYVFLGRVEKCMAIGELRKVISPWWDKTSTGGKAVLFLPKSGVESWWLTSVILAIQEAEIRRIAVRSQPVQIVQETLSRKTLHKNRAGGVAQGEDPEFKPPVPQKKKKKAKA